MVAMLEVKDLEVYYGVIQAIKGISFEVEPGRSRGADRSKRSRKDDHTSDDYRSAAVKGRKHSHLREQDITQDAGLIRWYPWESHTYRKDAVYLQSCPYSRT